MMSVAQAAVATPIFANLLPHPTLSPSDPIEMLGVQDLSRPEYGDPVEPHSGDVPVFWACGVTGVEAVKSSSGCFEMTCKHKKSDLCHFSQRDVVPLI